MKLELYPDAFGFFDFELYVKYVTQLSGRPQEVTLITLICMITPKSPKIPARGSSGIPQARGAAAFENESQRNTGAVGPKSCVFGTKPNSSS